ncbi:MAG TPA: transglutaminase family protein [Tahibacter sp.]|nr:transglutaminase family protein [Tahibacter sp.]
MKARIFRCIAWGLCALSAGPAAADLAPLRAQFQLPDEQVDYAAAKLTVDRLIDPATDAAAVHRELDAWERAVRGNLPANPTQRQMLDALLKTLYEPGPWNQHKPFGYDFSDPTGRNGNNKRLATYLATRKGNCISMPVLFVILGRRLGLRVALATAPHHVLVKFSDDTQRVWLNVEATAGGIKSDGDYVRETDISAAALDNGLYLRPLSPREGVGVIAGSLMEHYRVANDPDALMAVADLALAANPRDSVAMIWKGTAYYLQIAQRFQAKYPDPADIPDERRAELQHLLRENLAWFSRAESLGWTQPTPEQEARYLQSIQREKERRGQ